MVQKPKEKPKHMSKNIPHLNCLTRAIKEIIDF